MVELILVCDFFFPILLFIACFLLFFSNVVDFFRSLLEFLLLSLVDFVL
jgi:hypothetical protein